MSTVLKIKLAIIAGIVVGLTATVFVTQAFLPEEADSNAIKDYVLSMNADDFDSYTDPDYGFSVNIPKDFIVSSFPLDEGEMIIAEHPNFNLGFEIFISPYNGDEITADRIREANPSLLVEDPTETELMDGTPALRFVSEDAALGETRQILFTRGGNLFQVVMYSENTEWLAAWARGLVQDWTFTPSQSDLAL